MFRLRPMPTASVATNILQLSSGSLNLFAIASFVVFNYDKCDNNRHLILKFMIYVKLLAILHITVEGIFFSKYKA